MRNPPIPAITTVFTSLGNSLIPSENKGVTSNKPSSLIAFDSLLNGAFLFSIPYPLRIILS